MLDATKLKVPERLIVVCDTSCASAARLRPWLWLGRVTDDDADDGADARGPAHVVAAIVLLLPHSPSMDPDASGAADMPSNDGDAPAKLIVEPAGDDFTTIRIGMGGGGTAPEEE